MRPPPPVPPGRLEGMHRRATLRSLARSARGLLALVAVLAPVALLVSFEVLNWRFLAYGGAVLFVLWIALREQRAWERQQGRRAAGRRVGQAPQGTRRETPPPREACGAPSPVRTAPRRRTPPSFLGVAVMVVAVLLLLYFLAWAFLHRELLP